MAASPMPSPALDGATPQSRARRGRTSTISSVAHSVQNVATELLHKDPPPGFFAATAEAAAHAPTIGEIRRGSFGADGWHAEPQVMQKRRTFSQGSGGKRRSHRLSTGSRERERAGVEREEQHGGLDVFPALTEEPSRVSRYDQAQSDQHTKAPASTEEQEDAREIAVNGPDNSINTDTTSRSRLRPLKTHGKVHTSGYIPPPTIPWTTSTWIGLKAFWKWFLTPFGFLITIYGLNVVAWGGMLFLLLCNASPAMCWAPIHSPATEGHRSLAAALALNNGQYPRYHNCNDINSPRRVWLEIDSQILNALFCVTGFGLIPWRFRDLWFLLRWRLTSEKRSGRERRMYGLRVLAGISRGWFRLPGSQTLDQLSYAEYERRLAKDDDGTSGALSAATTSTTEPRDIEAADTSSSSSSDLRLPLPTTKAPPDPLTSIRAPPTAPWKLDFFVWSQVINTFFQACLCGFMWGMTRYNRPSWATGLFIALGCIIAGVGGLVSFLEGKKVKRVEGWAAVFVEEAVAESFGGGGGGGDRGGSLERTGTGRESVHAGEKGKGG
ncbi:hypothetical protein LTR85_004187 [Meristemomyces frigidus]|nr:hypothetical protein LTR85_004187 [Meristemomyces frigidus]